MTKYYEGGAMRRTGYATDNGVFYTLSDQLRSTSVLVNQNGTVKSRNYYYPYGGNRGGSAFSGITTKRFTGQYHEQGLPGGEGLAFYNARWYDARSACSSARIRWCPVRWRRRRSIGTRTRAGIRCGTTIPVGTCRPNLTAAIGRGRSRR